MCLRLGRMLLRLLDAGKQEFAERGFTVHALLEEAPQSAAAEFAGIVK
jgi:hypothetical protein